MIHQIMSSADSLVLFPIEMRQEILDMKVMTPVPPSLEEVMRHLARNRGSTNIVQSVVTTKGSVA